MAELRVALAANLDTITDTQVSAYMLSNPTPPVIHLFPAAVEYDLAMRRGLDKVILTVQAFVGFTTDIGAQKRLDLMLQSAGATSVKAAAESDKTLGGKAQDLRVIAMSGYKVFVVAGRPDVLGAEWNIEILATGT